MGPIMAMGVYDEEEEAMARPGEECEFCEENHREVGGCCHPDNDGWYCLECGDEVML